MRKYPMAVILLALFMPAAAQVGSIKEVPDPKGGYPTAIYVGRYGETVGLDTDWAIEPRMREEVEIIHFHRKHKDEWRRHPYQPAESDYKPENFTPMGLMQLIVIPKNAPGGMLSLKAIRNAKEAELKQNGIDYELYDDVLPSAWPPDSFIVLTKKPYRLRQIYAESPKEFFILTMGGKLEKGDYGLTEDQVWNIEYAQGQVSTSLGEYLLAFPRTRVQPSDIDWFHYFRTTDRFWKICGAFSVVMLILAAWPGTSPMARTSHLFGASLLLFTLLSGLAGFLAVFLPGQFGIYWQIDGLSAFIPAVLFPWISWAAARRFGSSHPNRVLAWSAALAVAWTVFLFQPQGVIAGDIRVFLYTAIFLWVGLTFGIVFALAFGPLPRKPQS